MPSLSAYLLTWVSLTLDVGYLFMPAPAKHSCCSLPWMWGSSSQPLHLTVMVTQMHNDCDGGVESILKEINHEYSLEGLMLKLNREYFGQLMQRSDSLEKSLLLGKIEDRKSRGPQRMRCLYDINNLMDLSLSKL